LDDLVETNDPALAIPPTEDNSDVGAALASLAPEYRQPLVLQVIMGYSTDEIARKMGLTQNTVLSRLHRARQKLRVALCTSEVSVGSSVSRTFKATPSRRYAA
jgi:RNA polymerase sigma-70 factor (ECF subfamily)